MAANKLVNKAVPILFIFCVAIIGMFFLLGGHANAASEAKYGTAVIPGVSTAPDVSYETPVRVAISDEECKAIIAQTWGSDAAAKAHRVAEPDRSITAPFNYATQQNRQTSNYCGYMSEVSGQYGAQGTFNVCFNTTGHQATWIGLGGINEVFQAGIDGMAGYRYAWIQFCPYGAPAYYYPVQQNDAINVSVGRDYLGNWVAIIYDTTSGQYASESWSTVNERTGAWIVEKVYPDQLGTFGTVQFSNCKWWNSGGTTYNINQGTGYYYRTYIQSTGGTQVWPSTLSGGNSFTVTRN